MGLDKNRTFVRKPYDKQLYKWSPQTHDKKAKKKTAETNFFCTAKPFTNGEDFIVTYVYEQVYINGVEHRYAYVACNYVE